MNDSLNSNFQDFDECHYKYKDADGLLSELDIWAHFI